MRIWMKSLQTIAVFGVAMLFVPRGGTSSTYASQVSGQLLVAGMALMADGYEMIGEPYTGELNRSANDYLRINLRASRKYTFVGVCDSDCGDLDIYVYDENDRLVSSDTKADDMPVVSVTPRWSGEFKIKVRMVRCSAQPCYYGLGNFRK